MSTWSQELRELSDAPELRKYNSALPEDFMEDFPRLPPEANPLDPRFADPRALARQVLPNRRGGGGGGQRVEVGGRGGRRGWMDGLEGQPGGRIDEEALFAEMIRLQEMGINVTMEDLIAQVRMLDGAGRPGVRELEGNVDLTAPLMQLFLQTFLPWSRVGPRRP